MKQLLLIVAIVLLLSPRLFIGAEEASSALLINKEEYSYKAANPDIEDLQKISSLTINENLAKAHFDENQTGVYSIDDFQVDVIVTDNHSVSFISNYPVQFIFIKGGNQGGNLYYYNPSTQNDSQLTTPNNTSNSKAADLSHLVFYYYKPVIDENDLDNPGDPDIDEELEDPDIEDPNIEDPIVPEDPIIPEDPKVEDPTITEDPENPITPNEPEDPITPEVPSETKKPDTSKIEEPIENPINEIPLVEPTIPEEPIFIEQPTILDESPIPENQEEFLDEDFLSEEIPEEAPLELPNTGGLPQILFSILGFFSFAMGFVFKVNK